VLFGIIALLALLPLFYLITTPLTGEASWTDGTAKLYFAVNNTRVVFPNQCLDVTWNVEGIKTVQVNGEGKIGTGTAKFCKTLNNPVLRVELQDSSIKELPIQTQKLYREPVTALLLISGVLRIVRNHLELIDYGERDTLTGLLNRKTFESQFDKLRRELASSARASAEGCWIGVVDIDHFKAVNDGYGHVIGDEVLLLVSQIIRRSFRSDDRVYRFGGEEFVVLLRDTPEAATAGAMERLRAAVEAHRFPQLGRVTVSIGWTRIRPHDAPATAIARAAGAL
jgi:diguanylate cyclase (GGDEF)-like protein